MELYILRLLPSLPRHLFFLILTACCVSLFPCSFCLDAQYQYCQKTSKCGTMTITYPFGVGNRGCGLPNFQINCVQNSIPVIQIHGRSYTILSLFSPKRFDIVRGENCNFFYPPNNNFQMPPSEHGNALFIISGKMIRTIDVYKCNIPFQDAFNSTGGELWKCNATVYYDFYNSGHSIRGCSMEQVDLEVEKAGYVSNDTQRYNGCKSCEASGGICGYNISDSTGPFLCYCKDRPRTHKCPGNGRRNSLAIIIALGTSRGIAYLHQDCEKRIIHFDIKPHNILLDSEFTPKVSDFGLAKLCGKGDDHISMTGARGTPGYVAPEVWSTDLGPVTDKSDVYSYGMLLLEIVGGRKNIDVRVSRSSQFYFPEWAFKLLESGELGMRLRGGMETEDEEKARRLTKVGLWCIQYKSTDRPCMNRVVQMLEGNGDDVTTPPLPFNCTADPENPLLSNSGMHSDFGISHVTTIPQGTPGYVDPEYYQCYQLTEKSDVYSFGVVLVEIISAKIAMDINRNRREINLANLAITKIREGSVHQIVDPQLDIEVNHEVKVMVTAVAELAFRCLASESDDRPEMKEVVADLGIITGLWSACSNPDQHWGSFHNGKQPLTPTSVHDNWPSINSSPNYST